jgi:hypothetical protein
MSWTCRMVDDWRAATEVGDMAFIPLEDIRVHADGFRSWRRYRLSESYERDHAAHRQPLCVRLPDGSLFCPDSNADGDDAHRGWTVTGEPPRISVSPSINVVGHYHGFLQEGVLSDDVEGRTF